MPTPRNAALKDMTRVFLLEDGAGPATAPEYMGVWKAGAVSWDFGESTAVEIPSDSEYQKFDEIATIAGTQGKPSLPFTARFMRSLSDMLRVTRRGCVHDFQVHIGMCGDPQNFNAGWEKVLVLEGGRISNYGVDEVGALSSDERAAVNETITAQGTDYYEIGPLSFAEVAASAVIQEVIDITFCDTKSCGGECGDASDGCEKVFAIIKSAGGSPGLGSQVVFTSDGGSTWTATPITALAANQEPLAVSCFGSNLIIVSTDLAGHVYTDRDDLILGIHTWVTVTTGYQAGGEPRDLFVLKPGYCWIVGAGGYVYFLDDPANAPTIQDAGSATVQDLNAIHAYDEENVLAVGDSNSVIHTTDGETWTAVTGPSVGVDLNCCWMKDENTWFVGTNGGRLYYTQNQGATWVEKAFPGSAAGVVHDIVFVNDAVGYLSHATAAPLGRILRTIDGGYSWYVLPEGTATMPANDRFNALTVCDNPNIVFGGGLGDNASDGIIVKGSSAGA